VCPYYTPRCRARKAPLVGWTGVPELPEVETARRNAERALRGLRIVAVAVAPDPIVYRGVSPSRFAAALRGRRVLAA
jgi:formamidopyrimidine-DNA glycosylase